LRHSIFIKSACVTGLITIFKDKQGMKRLVFLIVGMMFVVGTYSSVFAARLIIGSTPGGAAVMLDTASCGLTPATIDNVIPGQHSVILKKKGYYSKKMTITVTSDSVQQLTVNLIRPGSVVLYSDPPGARCFMDTIQIGTTPFETAKLKPGDYGIRFELLHYTSVQQRVKIADGRCDTVRVLLSMDKAYQDSVFSAVKHQDSENKKVRGIVKYAVIGLFAILALVVVGFESSQPK
jgi:hypothetical protein